MPTLLRIKIIFSTILFLSLAIVAGIIIYQYNPALAANRCTDKLQPNSIHQQALTAWTECISHTSLFDSKSLTKPVSTYTILQYYSQFYQTYNHQNLLNLYPIDLTISKTTKQQIPFTAKTFADTAFIKGQTYDSQVGKNGEDQIAQISLSINSQAANLTIWQDRLQDPETQISFTGGQESSTVKALIKNNFQIFVKDLVNDNLPQLKTVSKEAASQIILIKTTNSLAYRLGSISDGVVNLSIKPLSNNSLVIGDLEIVQQNCSHGNSIPFSYDIKDHKYYFTNVQTSLNTLCSSAENTGGSPNQEILLSCTDCTYAPVDKTYKLRNDYEPTDLTDIDILGGGRLTKAALAALDSMNADAAAQGISLKVVSAYRSYSDQQNVFEGWVQSEMAQGYSRAEAEVRANDYSAWPGHSEHQLGTTADLSCGACNAFDSDQLSQQVYTYLLNNAYRFGFAISYPQNSEQLTGYRFEPWHVRFIGIQLATELFNTGYLSGSGTYLAEFLRSRALY